MLPLCDPRSDSRCEYISAPEGLVTSCSVGYEHIPDAPPPILCGGLLGGP
jgi:hypothetical protein